MREGDANSKFFHSIMSSRRRANDIYVFDVGGIQVEGVGNVRAAMFNYFSNRFNVPVMVRPRPVDLNFLMLSYREGRP